MSPRVPVALAVVAAAAAASAQPAPGRPPVRWETGPCAAIDVARARRVLAVELQDLLLADGDARPDAVRIALACTPERVTLRAASPGAADPAVRAVAWSALPDGPRARARTVALLAVEMAFLAWARAPAPAPPAGPSAAPAPAAPAPAAPAPRPADPRAGAAWRVLLAGAVRVLGRSATAWGGTALVGYELPSGLALVFDAEALVTANGPAPLSLWDAGLGVGVVTPWQSWRFRLDGGVRAGVGATGDGSVGWVSPYLRVGGALGVGGAVAVDFSGAMGVGLATDPRGPAADLEGVWCGAQAGVAWQR
jgi:hypothetical protein